MGQVGAVEMRAEFAGKAEVRKEGGAAGGMLGIVIRNGPELVAETDEAGAEDDAGMAEACTEADGAETNNGG